ncbi:DUF4974 domain-containing protein [Sinomicrobium kalidii]|uniref:FecR family protein n=1 Tax=Sinomicrobium kalidii TaxID=2900738 RepID=UPI001E4D2699|nr:FecR family protein [Sinomicrobium kalidii]UGU16452.1 DUF4974 domain-containing protein [Sinomicrobium kalidii]
MKQDSKSILQRYFSGKCSPEEKQIIEDFLLQEDNASLSEYLESTWETTAGSTLNDEEEAGKRYQRLRATLYRGKSKRVWIRAAAVAAVLITVSLSLVGVNSGKHAEKQWVTLTTAAGEHKNIVLPDSSRVWLNCASSVRYPETFDGPYREVHISGEAFFEVTKNREKPFIAVFGDHQVRVLGTSFDIKAYPDAEYHHVTLVEGRVNVEQKTNGEEPPSYAVLQPNERLVLSASGQSFQKQVLDHAEHAIAWKKGEIRFHKAGLQEVVRELRRWFDADIVLKSPAESRDITFTAVIKPGASVDDVLKILGMTRKISYEKKNRQIVITPN